jgi:uncharacterized membrane protein YfcA
MLLDASIFSSYSQWLLTGLILFLAQTIYVLFGFGLGLIAVGILALFIQPLTHVIVILLFVALPAEAYVIFTSWRKIEWKGLSILAAGVTIGTVLGTLILKYGNPVFILTVLAGFLITAGFLFLITDSARVIRWPLWVIPVIGLSAGLLAGMFGTGGPPLIFYYHLSGLKKEAFRGSLMALFTLMALIRIPSYALAGLITLPRIVSSLYLLPAVVGGIWLGNRIHVRISEEGFRRLVSIGLIIIGGLLLLKRYP